MYGFREAMMGPGGLIYDGGFPYWAGGCCERPPKRPRFTEPNYYFGGIGIPAQGFAEVCNMPPIASGSNQAWFFGPNPYVGTGTTFSHSSRTNGIRLGESTASLHDFPGVRIRGLPFNCQERHIYSFFMGLDVVDCLFINNNWGFTGEAYVVFSNPMQVQLALQRVRQNVGHRYIELFACKKRDCHNVVAAKVNSGGYISGGKWSPPPRPRNKRPHEELMKDEKKSLDGVLFTEVLKLRGLPYSVSKAEILEFFGEQFDLKEADIIICCWHGGKATREAFARFSSAEVAKKAMCRDKMTIGSWNIELFPSTAEAAGRANRSRSN